MRPRARAFEVARARVRARLFASPDVLTWGEETRRAATGTRPERERSERADERMVERCGRDAVCGVVRFGPCGGDARGGCARA